MDNCALYRPSILPRQAQVCNDQRVFNLCRRCRCEQVIVGMPSHAGSAGSDYRDQFSGYSITTTPPGCTGHNAVLKIERHDAGKGQGNEPTSQALASQTLGGGLSTADWTQLKVCQCRCLPTSCGSVAIFDSNGPHALVYIILGVVIAMSCAQ